MTNTNYKLYNPSAGNDYVDVSGSAISNSNQPVLNKGRAINIGTSNTTHDAPGMNEILLGDRGRTVFGSQILVSARQGINPADYSGTTSLTSVASNGSGLCRFTKTAHGLAVGDTIIVADTNSKVNGPQRVIAVPTSATFDTDKKFTTGAGTLTYGTVDGTFATMTAEKYVMRKVTTLLHNVANTTLRSGGSDYGIRRSIHKVETAFRHSGVATAIRAGYWNEYSGSWSTAPTATNNSVGNVGGSTVTNGTADQAATPSRSVPGELVYREGGKPSAGDSAGSGVRLDDYKATTI